MPSGKPVNIIPKAKLEAYNKLVATIPAIERKGDTVPYTSYNGHMFSYLEKDGSLGLRLPEVARQEFLQKYKTTLFVSYGIVKKEYVLVPDRLLGNLKDLMPYFEMSLEYVKSLKPKPSKKAAK
jgi:hypothetical protein